MKLAIIKEKCSGCSACYSICPKQCIEMKSDEYGFLYPSIDEKECINCGLCERICPFIEEIKSNNLNISYAAVNKDKEVLNSSSSGGIFYELASSTINIGGYVVGAAFSCDYGKVEHIIVDNLEDLKKLQTSKYVQSIIGDIYTKTKELLDENKEVLFSGTPCQVSGLKNYLRKDYSNLLCVEIICHGVPSTKVWNKYLDYIKKRNNGTVEYFNFRSKYKGWKSFGVLRESKSKIVFEKANDNIYMQFFLNNLSLRSSCFNCKAKENGSKADIILGDFWGIENVLPNINYKNGVSAVIVNTNKGIEVLDNIKDNINLYKVEYNDIVKYNSPLISSVKMPNNYYEFMNDLNTLEFEKLIKKYKVKHDVKYYVRKIVKMIIKSGGGYSITYKIKR